MVSTAVVFALLSLVFAGVNDVVFKRYNHQDRSRGMLIGGIGVVWMSLQLVDVQLGHRSLGLNHAAWVYGSAAGICVAAANIALLVALRRIDVSLGSTIYRLNTIGVVILSVLVLNEHLSILKVSGIALGVLAVLLLYHQHESKTEPRLLRMGLAIIIIGSALRALFGVISKAGLSEGVSPDALILLSAACWIISGLSFALIVERRFVVTPAKIRYALTSGILVYVVAKTLVTALSLGEASIVVPIANMSFVVALLIAVGAKMERLTTKKIAAMLFAAGAITVLSQA
ncbi:MAG: EamA family transporter [Gammaproteobacteria bacterium]|nr:EamA family transporter [Gammaproteobacteria bacterium]